MYDAWLVKYNTRFLWKINQKYTRRQENDVLGSLRTISLTKNNSPWILIVWSMLLMCAQLHGNTNKHDMRLFVTS